MKRRAPYRFRLVAPLAAAMFSSPAAAQTIYTFRDGLDGYNSTIDTHLRTSGPDEAHGASEFLIWDTDDPIGTNKDTWALLRFDDIFGLGPGEIPPGSAITSATLTYNLESGASVGALHDALVDWTEATTFNTFGAGAGVQSTEYSSDVIATPFGSGASHALNVTKSLTTWTGDPSLNHGWIFRSPNRFTSGRMRSSEYAADPTKRPTLTVVVNDTGIPSLLRAPYLQSASPNSVTVAWRTDMLVDSVVRYGDSPASLTHTVALAAPTREHFVPLTSLEPGATYYYEIAWSGGDIAGADASHVFTTPPADNSTPFTIWALGDSGRVSATQDAVRDAMLAVNGGAPDLIIHAGDIAYTQGADGEYTDTFFTPYADVLRQAPFWPSHGNHDNLSADSIAQAGPYYDAYDLLLTGASRGVPSGTEAYYSFDVGGAHLISLDSAGVPLAPGSPMLLWLADDLAASADADWIIAFFHHAPYSNGTHDSNTDILMTQMRENVVPILEAGGVDLVVGGHSHGYERSYLVNGAYETPSVATGKILNAGDGDPSGDGAYIKPLGVTPGAGAVYVVAGHANSGGGVAPHPLMAAGENAAGSCLITIDGQALMLRNVRFDGVVTDTVAIQKSIIGPCPADLTGDSRVDGADLAALLASWGAGASPSDLNSDNAVDGADLAALLAAWGPCL